MFIAASPTLEGAIVLSDDFEANSTNISPFGNGHWISTPNLAGWKLTDNVTPPPDPPPVGNVAGTDAYSSPDGTYFAPHSGHITAAFFAAGNGGGTFTSSMSRDVVTGHYPTGSYEIRFWISNPIADPNARQNLFSVTWGGISLNLASYDPLLQRFKAPVTPLDGGHELFGGADEYVVDSGTNWFEVVIAGLTATSASTTLTFTGQNNNSATLVDDVTVTETPEPSSVILLGAGAALLGQRRRRRAVS